MSPSIRCVPRILFGSLLLCVLSGGCAESEENPPAPASPERTAEIGEFNPDAGLQVAPQNVQATDPIIGPLEILQNVRVRIPSLKIEHALNLYNAGEGNYPKSHQEFMTSIIEANRIALPELPAELQYQYDVANHKLVIVRAADGKIVE